LKRIALLSYSLIILLGLFSCKASKKTVAEKAVSSEIESIVTTLENNSFHPKWFKAKAKLQTKMDGRSMSFSSTIPYTDIVKKESDYLLAGTKEDYSSSLMVDAATMQTKYFYLAQSDSQLTVEYSDYRMVDGKHAMAHRRDIIVKRSNEEDIQLSIIYNSVDIDKEQNIKFDIPSSYSKM